jgi:penicillin-binding protein 2
MKSSMHMDDPQKQELIKRRHFSFRINLFFFCTFVLFSVLIVRLAILQFVHGKDYAEQENTTTNRATTITPIRGNIYDSSGAPLAYTIPVQSLYFRVEPGQQEKDLVISIANDLAKVFADYGNKEQAPMTAAEIVLAMDLGYDINKKETKAPSYYSVPRRIKADLNKDEVAYLLEHRDVFKWFEVTEESIRTYEREENDTTIATQLIGYLGKYSTQTAKNIYKANPNAKDYLETEEVGVDGIEQMYQDELRGKNGYKMYPVDAAQRIIGRVTVTPPEKGNNLHLTIHKDVQTATEKAITDHLDFLHSPAGLRDAYYSKGSKAKSGYAVAMEIDTGKIISMASMPDYDANYWIGGIKTENYNKVKQFVNNGTITTAYPNYPEDEIKNHPSSLVFLGSTIKPLTVLFGLHEKLFGLNEAYTDTGSYSFGAEGKQATIRNSDSKYNGSIRAADAIRVSSNTFMSHMIGNRLYFRDGNKGLDTWADFLKKFGLGVTTGSGLPKEYAGSNDFYANAKSSSAQSALIYAAWGQNEKYTTLQLAQFTATMASKGKRMKPLFVDQIKTYEGELVRKIEPEVLEENIFPEEYWKAIFTGMQGVNKRGFDDFPYSIATKTGTSTQDIRGKLIDNAVFIAFAPVDKPKLAVAVIVPEGGYGAYGAAPIARKIFDAYDQNIGLYGTPTGVPNTNGTAGTGQ